MSFKGTMRRTLALLLVLIFALSNMGLAEVADQVAESLPEAEASIEETAAETASDAAEEEGPAEAEPAEEESTAPEATAEETAEEAPAAPESVSVVVTEIDETSLCAYESIAPEGIWEVAYAWERATSADGEWEALDETGDVYSTDAEERFDYVYRCTVSVGDMSATSEPVAFSGAEYIQDAPAEEAPASEPIQMAADFEMEEIGVALDDATLAISGPEGGQGTETALVYNADAGTSDTVELTATVSDASGKDFTYAWSVGRKDDEKYISFAPNGNTVTVSLISAADTNAVTGRLININCRATCTTEGEDKDKTVTSTTAYKITVLPALTQAQLNNAFKFMKDGTEVTEFGQPASGSDNAAATAKLNGLNAGYKVTYSVDTSSGATNPALAEGAQVSDWLDVAEQGNTITNGEIKVKPLGAASPKNTFTNKDGQTFTIKAEVGNGGGNKLTATKTLTILPEAASVTIMNGDKEITSTEPLTVAAYDKVTLTAKFAPATGAAVGDVFKQIRVIGSVDTSKNNTESNQVSGWTFTDKGVSSAKITGTASGNSFTFVPIQEGEYAVSVVSTVEGVADTHSSDKRLIVKALPETIEFEAEEGSAGAGTEITKSYFVGETDVKPIKLFFGESVDAEDVYTEGIEWVVNDPGTGDGSTKKPLLSYVGEGAPAKGATELTINPIRDDIADNGKVTFTITAKCMPEGTDQPETVTLTYTINILTETTGSITASDIKFDPEIIGQPYQLETDAKTPAYAQSKASILKEALADYGVEWVIADADQTFAGNNDATSTIFAKPYKVGSSASSITWGNDANGKEITVTAKIPLKKDPGESDYATAEKKIIIRPIPQTINFAQMQGSTEQKVFAHNDTITVPKGESGATLTLKLKPAAGDGIPATVKLLDSELSATWTPDKEADGSSGVSHNMSVSSTDNTVGLAIDTVGHYTISATAKKGDDALATSIVYVDVVESAPDASVTPSVSTGTLYNGSTLGFEVKALEADGKESTKSIGVPSWTLAVTNVEPLDDQEAAYESGIQWATNGNEIILYEDDYAHSGRNVELQIPGGFGEKIKSGAKITVTVSFPGTQIANKVFNYDLKALPADVKLTDESDALGELELDAFYSYTATGIDDDNGDADKVFIAQGGEDASISYKIADGETEKAKTYADLTSKYTLKYSISKSGYTADKVAKYITIDQNGNISAKPLEAGDNPGNSVTATNAGDAFTITYALDGIETLASDNAARAALTATKTITLVKAPANVAIELVEDGEVSSDKELPKMLTINTAADMIGVLVPASGAITAGEAPELSISTTSKNTFEHPNKEPASSGKEEYWRLTAKPTAKTDMLKVTITASHENCTKTATADIYINGETIDLADSEGNKTCEHGKDGVTTHVWVLKEEQNNPDGHVYECVNSEGGTCNAESAPVKHSNFSIIWDPSTQEKDKKDENVLWIGSEEAAKLGHVDCAICDFTCNHTYKEGTIEYKNSEYHEGVCDTCGKTVRQAHKDGDDNSECDICKGSAAKVDFGVTQPWLLLVDGDSYTPEVSVSAGDSYTVTYSVEGDSANYLTLVSAKTGEVKGKAASPEDFDPVLTANITTTQGGTTKTVKGELKFTVKEKVSSISISSDANKNADGSAYLVIPASGETGKVLKLTATISPDAEKADLSGYKWQFDTTTNTEEKVKFVTPNVGDNGAVDSSVPWKDAEDEDLNKPIIYVKVENGASATNDKPVIVKYARTEKPKEPAGTLKIDLLEIDTTILQAMISFNGAYPGAKESIETSDKTRTSAVNIIQGQSMPVSLLEWKDDTKNPGKKISSAFDSRFGTVEFSVVPVDTKEVTDLNPASPVPVLEADKNRWIRVTTTDANAGTGTVQSVAPGGTLNSLADSPYTAAFKVTATVTHDWLSASRIDTVTGEKLAAQTTASRIVWIVPNTTTAKFQYKEDELWHDFPANGLNVDEGQSIDVKLTIVDNGKPSIDADAVTWNSIAEKNGKFATETDSDEIKKNADGSRTFTVASEGADDSITISGTYPGLSIPPVKLNVKRLIHEITLTCDATAYNAGEEDTVGEVSNPKSFTITAATDTQDHNDKLIWTVMAKDGRTPISDITLEDVGTDGLTKKITLPGKRKQVNLEQIGPEVVITVTAEKSKDKDGNPIQKTHTVKIFQTPDLTDNGLEIKTEKATGDGTTLDDGKLYLTVGESTKFAHIGWDSSENTLYGASAEASVFEPQVEYPVLKDEEADAGKDVITISGDTVTAVAEGTAQITIQAFNYPESNKETLDVVVNSAVDVVEADENAEFEKTYTIGVNEPEAERETIKKNSFKAYRNVTDSATGTTTKEEAKDAKITLVSDNACLEIVETKKGTDDVWQLVGKSVGTAHVYAYVNETANTKADPIEVKVEAAPEGIHFEQNGAPVGAQLITSLEEPETFVLTAVTEPAGATGEISIKATNPDVIDLKVEGNIATLTPKTQAGKSEVTAEIYNPDYDATAGESLLNPSKLTARVEILVTTEAGGTTQPGSEGVSLVGKKAIGPDETTQLVATGVDASKTVVWTADPETAATLQPDAQHKSVTITPATTGKVTVTATVDGTVIGSETIYLLTAPEEIKFTRGDGQTLTMAVGETLKLGAAITKGYDFTPEVASEASGVQKDYSNLFTYSSNLESRLTVTGENGDFVAKAISKPTKKQTVILTVKAGKATKDITVIINAPNKSFSIGKYNDSTLYMAPGQKKTIEVTSKPSASPASLIYEITDEEGNTYTDEVPGEMIIAKTATSSSVEIDPNANPSSYQVTVKAEGYTNHAEQHFTVVVRDEVNAKAKIAVEKIGVDAYENPVSGKVTAVKGEKLQAMIVDADTNEPVAGDITWTAQSKGDKKIAEINTVTGVITAKKANSVQIGASAKNVAGETVDVEPLTVEVVAVPNGKISLKPTDKTRTVAVYEPFELGLTGIAYPDTQVPANKWYTISWNADLGLEDQSTEESPNTYVFTKAGVVTLTLKPVWGGKAQTVKFTVVKPAATEFEVPSELTIATSSTTIVRATMEGYANLTWLAGAEAATATEITTKTLNYNGDKNIKLTKLANDEIQIKTTKNAGGTIDLLVKGPGAEDGAPIKVTIGAASTSLPEETKVVFDKQVITVGESTNVYLATEDGEVVIPSGTVTYKYVKSAGKASVKGNVVKATKAGEVTVSAKLGTSTIEGKLYVIEKAKIETALKPTKMGEHETLAIGVTITNYDATKVPEAYKELVSTEGVLTAESNSSMISAELTREEDTEAPNKYQLILTAGDAVKTSKGKFTSATITLRLTNGQKKTMKIQVVEAADENAVYMRDVITMAPKTSVKLIPAVAEGTAYAANFDWHFIDQDSADIAAKHFLTLADGKLSTTRDSTATTAEEEIIIEGSYGETTKTIQVVIANKKAGKNQFKLVQPNRDTVYIGEKILGKIEFNPGVGGGDITWKSSKSKIISVDKTTGLYTVIGPAGKSSAISATVNGKSSTQAKKTLNVAPAPTKIAFDQADITLAAGGEPINLTSHVLLDGKKLSGDYSGALVFESSSNLVTLDKDTGVISAAPAVEESAIVTVTSFNGLTAQILVVVGQGSGTTPGGDPTDKTPNTIELYSQNATQLTAQNLPVVLTEGGATFKPVAVVKNKEDYALSDATVTWDFTPKSETNPFISIAADGTVTPLRHTLNEDNTHTTVTVTATCGAATASYTLNIEADKTKASNIALEIKNGSDVMESLLVGDGSSATVKPVGSLIVKIPDTKLSDIADITSVKFDETATDYKRFVKVESTGGNNKFNLTAEKAGTDTLTFQVTLNTGETASIKQEVNVNELPAKDALSITDASGAALTEDSEIVVGKGEVPEFHVSIQNFNGTPGNELEAKVYKTDGDNGEVSGIAERDAEDAQKFTFKSGESDIEAGKTYKVEVKLYENRYTPKSDCPTASFKVTVKAAPKKGDYEVTGTPEIEPDIAAPDYKITLGLGESVTLSAALEESLTPDTAGVWTKGLVWEDITADYGTDATPADKATLEPTGMNGVKVTYSKAISDSDAERKIIVALHLKDDPNTSSKTELAKVTITYKPLPKKTSETDSNYSTTIKKVKDDGTLEDDALTAITIGENEKFTAKVQFTGTGYATNLTWKASSTYVTLKPNGLSCEITGKAASNGKTPVEVYYGSLLLGRFQLTVNAAPTQADLVLKEKDDDGKYTKTFSYKLSASDNAAEKNSPLKVAVVLNGKSADLLLESPNPCVDIKAVTDSDVPEVSNCWTIEWKQNADGATDKQKTATSATLKLSSPENDLYANFNLTIDHEMAMGGDSPVKSAKPLDPVKTFPNGFKSEDGTTGATAAEVTKNQAAITASVESGSDTIKLTGAIDEMATWKSATYTKDGPGENKPHNWYCLIIDTGYGDITNYYRAAMQDTGSGATEPEEANFESIPEDENGAKMGFGSGYLVEWLPLDKAKSGNVKSMTIYVSSTQNKSNAKKFVINFEGLSNG